MQQSSNLVSPSFVCKSVVTTHSSLFAFISQKALYTKVHPHLSAADQLSSRPLCSCRANKRDE